MLTLSCARNCNNEKISPQTNLSTSNSKAENDNTVTKHYSVIEKSQIISGYFSKKSQTDNLSISAYAKEVGIETFLMCKWIQNHKNIYSKDNKIEVIDNSLQRNQNNEKKNANYLCNHCKKPFKNKVFLMEHLQNFERYKTCFPSLSINGEKNRETNEMSTGHEKKKYEILNLTNISSDDLEGEAKIIGHMFK